MMKKYHIAIVGATGAVGKEMLHCIYEYNVPYKSITLLASSRSKGKEIIYNQDTYIVQELCKDSFKNIDIAFFSAGGSISKQYIPIARAMGCICIDNTSYFRMNEEVPLVVPEVNKYALTKHQGIIANPNCTTIQMVSALNRINDHFNIKRIIVSTYQAVSGAGIKAMEELYSQSNAVIQGKECKATVLPVSSEPKHYPIAFNCIPQVDVFENNHYTKEEMKMVNETQKIFNKSIDINATCVRVPVLRGHSESIYIETDKEIEIETIYKLLKASEGVALYDDIEHQIYPMPTQFIGDPTVYVGRIRQDLNNKYGLNLWVVSDQLMKGAAYNAIDIALTMIDMNLI